MTTMPSTVIALPSYCMWTVCPDDSRVRVARAVSTVTDAERSLRVRARACSRIGPKYCDETGFLSV